MIQLANLAIMREDFDAAQKLLKEADELSPQNLQVAQLYVEFLRRNPKAGFERAMQFLDRVVQKFGDLPALRLRDGIDTGSRRFAADMHGARATLREAAAIARSVQIEIVPQRIEPRHAWIVDFDPVGPAVYLEI